MKKTFTLLCLLMLNIALFAQWNPQTSGFTGTSYSVYFVNANVGYCTADNDSILKTTNGGTTWTKQRCVYTLRRNSVFFTSVDTGYIAGGDGIIKTTNGGATWTSQTSGLYTGSILTSIFFLDANRGFAVGNYSGITKTTNGGTNWQVQTSPISSLSFQSIHFSDTLTGVVVGLNGKIFKTTNGGTTWVAQTSGTTYDLNSVCNIDANTWCAVGGMGRILKGSNTDTNWVTKISGTGAALTSVCFANANIGMAVGQGGTILKTADGGDTWVTQTTGVTNFLYSVCFTDVNTWYAVGMYGIILKTTNGGGVWVKENSNKESLKTYPNPANNFITIENNNDKIEKYTVTLRNIQGQQVMSENVEFANIYKMDISKFVDGIYFLTLQNDKEHRMQKILIQR